MIFTVVALPARNVTSCMPQLLTPTPFFHQTQGFTLAAREDTGVTLCRARCPWPRSLIPMWAPG